MPDSKHPPQFKTERLILRLFELSDAKDVQRLAGEKAVAETTFNIPHPYEDGMAEEWISTHQSKFEAGELCNFAITLTQTGELIGAIGLIISSRHNHAELGYWVGVPYWNQGFCTEAAKAVLEYGFRDLELNRVHAHFLSYNPASGRVMSKIGMRHEGILRKHIRVADQYEDIEIYGILADDWRASAKHM
jgi:RimJ/RimL family protein N-acetyltransferase